MNLATKSMSLALAGIMAMSTLAGAGMTAFARTTPTIKGATLNLNQAVSIDENNKLYTSKDITKNLVVEKLTAETAGEFGSYYDATTDKNVNYSAKDVLNSYGINDTYTYYYLGSILEDNKSTVSLTYSDGKTDVVSLGDCDDLQVVDPSGNEYKTELTYSTEKYNVDKSETKFTLRSQSKTVYNGTTYDYSFKAGKTYNLKLSFGETWNSAKNDYDYAASVVVPLTINHAGTTVANVKAATYWAKGYTGDTICTDCGAVVKSGVATAKKAATLSTVKSSSKATLKATYKKVSGAAGYQVSYSTSSKFTTKTTKTSTVKGVKNTSKTIKKLKTGKKYYVRVRAYKTVNGKKVYSSWSKVKSVTVKK